MKKTSKEWQELYPNPKVLDPDGWDRSNFQHSWYEEEIAFEEYNKRAARSTCEHLVMKRYNIPIRWESYTRIEVEAENLQEAVTKAIKQFLFTPDENYIDDSWEIDDIIFEEVNEIYSVSKLYNELWKK